MPLGSYFVYLLLKAADLVPIGVLTCFVSTDMLIMRRSDIPMARARSSGNRAANSGAAKLFRLGSGDGQDAFRRPQALSNRPAQTFALYGLGARFQNHHCRDRAPRLRVCGNIKARGRTTGGSPLIPLNSLLKLRAEGRRRADKPSRTPQPFAAR